MSERQSGSYGLRKAAAPKKFDNDFEYYYTKIKTTMDSPAPLCIKEERDAKIREKLMSRHLEATSSDSHEAPLSPKRRYEIQVLQSSPERQSLEYPTKRPRGRPRKYPVPSDETIIIPDVADMDEDYIHLKPKRDRKFMKEERVEVCETVEAVIESLEQGMGEDLMVEEVIPQAETHVIISADPEDEKRIRLEDLRRVRDIMEVEQAVISLPQQEEKENQPNIEIQQTVHIPEEAGEEILMLGIGSDEEGNMQDLSDVRVEVGTDGVEVPLRRPRRKYRRIKATPETLRHLKEFGADDKIECSECHKLLKPSSFRQHLKTHTGIKPFGCEVCEARFTRKGDVERHIRIVHNKQKPFACHRCPRSFGDKKNLRWHLMNHDKKLFYVCETCGFKFGKKEYYENHVRFIHPIPDEDQFEEQEEEEEEDCPTLAETLLASSMEVDEEGGSGIDYVAGGYVIKKGGNTISVHDPTDSMEGETIEISESQLQNLLLQNSYSKRVAIVNPKRLKYATHTKKLTSNIQNQTQSKQPKNSQVVSFKDLEKITNLSSEQLAKLHMTSKHIDSDGIEAVVIQIEQSSDPENDCEQAVDPEEVVISEDPLESDPIIINTHSCTVEEYAAVESQSQESAEQKHQPREVNIVVNKSSQQESSEADAANVQSLIDALLDAAKDSGHSAGGTSTS